MRERAAESIMLCKSLAGETRAGPVFKRRQTRQGISRGQHLVVLMPLLLIYFSLALYRIDHQSLWADEVSSVEYASADGPLLAHQRWFGGQGPLYFILLHIWVKWGWGTSEFGLRSLSVLLGGFTVCLLYVMGLNLGDLWVARIGTTLLATSPFLIWYSQEVRYVILMIPAALLAMYTFDRVLATNRPRWWLFYCCSLILAIAAFVVNVFLPLAQGLYLVSSPARRLTLRNWAVCQLLIFALFVWWANAGHVRQLGGYWQELFAKIATKSEQLASLPPMEQLSTGGSREFTMMALPYTFFTFSVGFSLGPSLRELHPTPSLETLRPHTAILLINSVLFGGLFLWGLTALWRQAEAAKFLALWLAAPIIGALGVSALISDMTYNVRYVAMALPAYLFILAIGIAAFPRPVLRMTLLAAVLFVNGFSLVNYYFNQHYSREDARAAARYLESAVGPGDVIVVVGNSTALQYYYRGKSPIIGWGKTDINSRSGLADGLRALSEAYDRIWLVAIRPWEGGVRGPAKAVLDQRDDLIKHKELPGTDIYSYQLH